MAATAAALAVAAAAPAAAAVARVTIPVATAAASAAPPRGGDSSGDRDRDSHAANVAATPNSLGEKRRRTLPQLLPTGAAAPQTGRRCPTPPPAARATDASSSRCPLPRRKADGCQYQPLQRAPPAHLGAAADAAATSGRRRHPTNPAGLTSGTKTESGGQGGAAVADGRDGAATPSRHPQGQQRRLGHKTGCDNGRDGHVTPRATQDGKREHWYRRRERLQRVREDRNGQRVAAEPGDADEEVLPPREAGDSQGPRGRRH